MKEPEDVQVILALHQRGWGSKKIAKELRISRNTVKKYIRQREWQPYGKPKRKSRLDGLESWLKSKLEQHRGNADVIRQELESEHKISVSLRTVERAVEGFRKEAYAQAKATVRFETEPGHQLQIDFGSTRVEIGGEKRKIHLFVATLGYSRRMYVEAFAHERQAAWLRGLEGAFYHFNGVPLEVLLDNPKALVVKHDLRTREVLFNQKFQAFSRYWRFNPRACAPYRARTKGKDESAVGYVKKNAIAGRTFENWEQLQQHLLEWNSQIADQRIHGTTGEQPVARFVTEADKLQPIDGRPPYVQVREFRRRVHLDSCVEVDTNRYSVPWSLVGESVEVEVAEGAVQIFFKGERVASHPQSIGSRQSSVSVAHLEGIVGAPNVGLGVSAVLPKEEHSQCQPELLRSLSEYEAVAGGAW